MSQARLKDAELGLFAPCPRGLEGILAKELTACGARNVDATDGGVRASGNMDVIMRANLMSRTASRILLKLAEGPYRSEHDINRLAMSIDWPRWFDVQRSIKVKTDGIGTTVRSLDYISLTVKDAICDRFRPGTTRAAQRGHAPAGHAHPHLPHP
ncbi:THUMP domain-containing protein [Paludibacterium denitrificans]|uniref:THUMP domain-containing protein n=1 Tax=Paludibacterium denitrificans TaxID=2675226 RepID=UPI0035E43F9C